MAAFGITGPVDSPVISIKIENLAEVQRELRNLPGDISHRILGQVVLQGARILRDETVSQAPVGLTGRLSDSITVRRAKPYEVAKDEEMARVIVSRSKKAFYAHLVEFGHVWVFRRRGRTYARGHWSGNPFMTRAWNAKKEEAANVMLRSLRTKVIRQANKIAARTGRAKLGKSFAPALR